MFQNLVYSISILLGLNNYIISQPEIPKYSSDIYRVLCGEKKVITMLWSRFSNPARPKIQSWQLVYTIFGFFGLSIILLLSPCLSQEKKMLRLTCYRGYKVLRKIDLFYYLPKLHFPGGGGGPFIASGYHYAIPAINGALFSFRYICSYISNYLTTIRSMYILYGCDATPLWDRRLALCMKAKKINPPFQPKIVHKQVFVPLYLMCFF